MEDNVHKQQLNKYAEMCTKCVQYYNRKIAFRYVTVIRVVVDIDK